jgi:hypothetical protein
MRNLTDRKILKAIKLLIKKLKIIMILSFFISIRTFSLADFRTNYRALFGNKLIDSFCFINLAGGKHC